MAQVAVKNTFATIGDVRPLVVRAAARSKSADALPSEELALRWKPPPLLSADLQAPDDTDFPASPSPWNCGLRLWSLHHQDAGQPFNNVLVGPADAADENTMMAPEDGYSQLVHANGKVSKESKDRIEIQGTGENCSQCRLKQLFMQFGTVLSCQIGKRGVDLPAVRFDKLEDADAAMTALRKGQVFLDGVMLSGEMKGAPMGGRVAKLKTEYCSFYGTPKGCKHGNHCEFNHDQSHAQFRKTRRAIRQSNRREKYERQRATQWPPLPRVAPCWLGNIASSTYHFASHHF